MLELINLVTHPQDLATDWMKLMQYHLLNQSDTLIQTKRKWWNIGVKLPKQIISYSTEYMK